MTLLQIILLLIGCFVSLFLTFIFLEITQDAENILIKCLSGAAFWTLILIDAVLVVYGFGCIIVFLGAL